MSRHIAVIVTGTRHALFEDWRQSITNALLSDRFKEKYGVLIHGDARGIDWAAGRIAGMHGWQVIPMPAQWDNHGRMAGPMRNQRMLDVATRLRQVGYDVEVLAFHDDIEHSKGTKNMVSIAYDAGVLVTMYTQDGPVAEQQAGVQA